MKGNASRRFRERHGKLDRYGGWITVRKLVTASLTVTTLYTVRRLFFTERLTAASDAVGVTARNGDRSDAVAAFANWTSRRRIPFEVSDLFPLTYNLTGAVYDAAGEYADVTAVVTTSQIHTFSPRAEARFREMMLDPARDHRVYANSPTMAWRGGGDGGTLLVVLRMWLEKEKHKRTAKKMRPPLNDYSDNYLYTQLFDRSLKPLTKGRLLGIVTPTQWFVGDGPIEPRLFAFVNRTFMTFNTGVALPGGDSVDSTFVWDYDEGRIIVPLIVGGAPMTGHGRRRGGGVKRDKHWAAFEDSGKLYFTYSLDPLTVMRCELDFTCSFVLAAGAAGAFSQRSVHLRGGTPWIEYDYPYYVSVGHGTFFKEPAASRYYAAHLIVMSVRPQCRIVYTSAPLKVHRAILDAIPIVRFVFIHDPFLFPVSALLESDDVLAFGAHVSDHSSVLFRVRGVRALMRTVIGEDKRLPPNRRAEGPPAGTVQNVTKRLAQAVSNYRFYD